MREEWPSTGAARRVAAVAAVLYTLFAAITVAVAVHPEPFAVDQWWAETLYARRSAAATGLARIMNAIGLFPYSVIIVIALTLVLWRLRGRLTAATFAIAEAVSWALSQLTKVAISRPRPADGLVDTVTASYPSGHSAFAAVTAVLLVGLLCAPGKRRWWALLAAAVALTMAWSRSYLLVHWLTDVVAGLLIGAAVGLTALAWRDWKLERANATASRETEGGTADP